MGYSWRKCHDHYEVVDDYGRFVCSADSRRDAEHEIDILEMTANIVTAEEMTLYTVSCLIAKARHITRGGKTLLVPVEEFRRLSISVLASSCEDALASVERPGFIVREASAYIVRTSAM